MASRSRTQHLVPAWPVGDDPPVEWVMAYGFVADVLVAIALVVLLPSGAATALVVRGRRAGRVRTPVRVFAGASYLLSALVLAALAGFLLMNQVRIVDVRLL